MTTKTRTIANAVKLVAGKGTNVFNDRLQDGTRSLKVWNWTDTEYKMAQDMLEQAGCTVRVVRVNGLPWTSRGLQTRLHVTE
jgi:hypothetical protein